MNRSLGALHTWVCGASPLFLTFHKQVSGGGGIPQENIWDDQRKSAENTVNPHYFEDLNIGALTLTDVGMSYYGPYSVLLGENFISQRTTVFEENPFIFNQRMQIISGQACPLGYRAAWDCRGDLAVAKLGAKIRSKMDLAAFGELLLTSSLHDSDEADFIEAQIYGPLHVRTILRVTGPVPKTKQDRALWNAVKRSLKKLGASWSEQ